MGDSPKLNRRCYGPLCRPNADAVDAAPNKIEGVTAPYVSRRPTEARPSPRTCSIGYT